MESQLFSLDGDDAGLGELIMSKDNKIVNSIDEELIISTIIKNNKIIKPARYLKDTNNNKSRIDTEAGIKKNVR